ncbi:DNA utilization protein YhiR [Actinobacillus pleuropneumoniae]|nr:DNA utilization protein YhiR [Actinobacillus pleuropneumoniae]
MSGRYSLLSAESEKTGEYLEGVARLWERTDLPEEVALYINELKKINKGEKLRYYAGSPLLGG